MYDDIRQNSITVKNRTNILGERKMFKTKKKKFLLPFLMDLGWQMMVFQTLQEVLQGSLPAFQEWNSTANSPTRHPPRTNDHWRWCLELKRKIKSKGWLSLHSVHPRCKIKPRVVSWGNKRLRRAQKKLMMHTCSTESPVQVTFNC